MVERSEPRIETKSFDTGPNFSLRLADSDKERALSYKFLREFHYLVDQRVFGRRIIHHVVDSENRMLAVLMWSNPLGVFNSARDKFLGLDESPNIPLRLFGVELPKTSDYSILDPSDFSAVLHPKGRIDWVALRRNFLRLYANRIFANNARYCVNPAIENRENLASRILAVSRKQIVPDWKGKYGDDLILLETFIDDTKFEASCYKADNWKYLSTTKGVAFYGAGMLKAQDGKRSWADLPKDIMRERTTPKSYYVYPLYDEKGTRTRIETLLARTWATTKPDELKRDLANIAMFFETGDTDWVKDGNEG